MVNISPLKRTASITASKSRFSLEQRNGCNSKNFHKSKDDIFTNVKISVIISDMSEKEER